MEHQKLTSVSASIKGIMAIPTTYSKPHLKRPLKTKILITNSSLMKVDLSDTFDLH